MERTVVSLCPSCIHCPEVVIEGDTIRIGEDANLVALKKEEWNVLASRRHPIWPARPRVGQRRRRGSDCPDASHHSR
jgi:hypothetical protein